MKQTKADKIEHCRRSLNANMALSSTTDRDEVLRGIDKDLFFSRTIGQMNPEQKHALYLACENLDKSDLEKLINAVGGLLVPGLKVWEGMHSQLDASIDSAKSALALKFVEEFAGKQQLNYNTFYRLFYLEQADEDEDMDL